MLRALLHVKSSVQCRRFSFDVAKLPALVGSAVHALVDPTRGDLVAKVGELSGEFQLKKLHHRMRVHPIGSKILREQPVVDEHQIDMNALRLLPHNTFGATYVSYMDGHEFSPSERAPVEHIADPELSYVMLRYRQCHDFWHVLSGLPISVLGELGLKWLEFAHMKMPVAFLSGVVAPIRLSSRDRRILREKLIPWAFSQRHMTDLMCIPYESYFEEDLDTLRRRVGIKAAPVLDL